MKLSHSHTFILSRAFCERSAVWWFLNRMIRFSRSQICLFTCYHSTLTCPPDVQFSTDRLFMENKSFLLLYSISTYFICSFIMFTMQSSLPDHSQTLKSTVLVLVTHIRHLTEIMHDSYFTKNVQICTIFFKNTFTFLYWRSYLLTYNIKH